MSEDFTKSEELPVGQLMLAIVLIWAAISVAPYVIQGLISPLDGWKLADHALLGDTFGFTNSFFSSLALAFLVYSSYLQRRDLALQRRALMAQEAELQLTREEHRKSAAAQAESAAELKEQNRLQLLSLQLPVLKKAINGFEEQMRSMPRSSPERSQVQATTNKLKDRYTELIEALAI